jgi:hypothetical protein
MKYRKRGTKSSVCWMSFVPSVISECTVMKHFALLPVMPVTVRSRDLSLKCDGEGI